MTKIVKKKERILKSKFFLKLFGVPSICISILGILGMFLPDESNNEPTNWTEFFAGMLIVLIFWFVISFIISLIVSKIKKSNSKTKATKEIQYMTKLEEKAAVKPESLKKGSKKNNRCLYTCESIIDAFEYKKMSKYFPQIYWTYVILGTLLNLIITSIIAIFSRNLVTTLIFLVVYQIFLMILYKVRLEHFAEKYFYLMQRKEIFDMEIHNEFYDDYLLRQSEKITIKVNYNDIEHCIETDTNFYLKLSKVNRIIIIQKNSCDLELINFIREKFNNLENCLGDKSNFKGVRKYHNPNFIKTFMIILFIITICSLWGALWTMSLADKSDPQYEFNFIKNTWVFWCWLPVPLLSVILGFKYKKAGFKCTKNIVGGFIIGFLLLIYGSFCLFPTFSQDYRKIDAYRNIIDASLPDNGNLEIQNWGTYFDEDKTDYMIMNVYYDKIDVSNLVNSIENNSNWVLSREINSELKKFNSIRVWVKKSLLFDL